MELEQLHDRLSEILVQLKFKQLQEVCVSAKIPTENLTKKHTLIRTISEAVDGIIEIEEEEVARVFLNRLIERAKEIQRTDQAQSEVDKTSEDAAALAIIRGQYADLQLSFQASTKRLEEEMARLTSRMNKPSQVQGSSPLTAPSALQHPEVTIRREFKINGLIGERGKKKTSCHTQI